MKYSGYVLRFTKRTRRGYTIGYDVRLIGTMDVVTVWLTTRDEQSIAFDAQEYRVVVTFEGERIKDEILDVEEFDFVSKEWIALAKLQEREKRLHEAFCKIKQSIESAKHQITIMKQCEKDLHEIGKGCPCREQLKEPIYSAIFVLDRLCKIVPEELIYEDATLGFGIEEMRGHETED